MKHLCALTLLACSLWAAPAHAQMQMPRAQWAAAFKPMMSTEACKAGSYFRQCFRMTGRECHRVMSRVTERCLSNLSSSLPATITSREQSINAGSRVGECAGTAFELQNLSRKIKKTICNDASNWAQ
jgi:hypothetical protein